MSAVVANCAMNRERQLTGVNSYARDLGFDPLAVVTAQAGAAAAGETARPRGWTCAAVPAGR
jgi:hypothetical protein